MEQQGGSGEGMDARTARDSLIEEALVTGLKYPAAAEFARCSVRTVRRRMDDEEFESRVSARRAERTAQQTSALSEAGWSAIDVLVRALDDPDPGVRMRSAQMILTMGSRYRRDVEFSERIGTLEKRIALMLEAGGPELES